MSRKITGFALGLISLFAALNILLLLLVPLIGIPLIIAYVATNGAVFRGLFARPNIDPASSELENKFNARLDAYATSFSIAAGILTSYLLLTSLNPNPTGTWIRMTMFFAPIYLLSVALITASLVTISSRKRDTLPTTEGVPQPKLPLLLSVTKIVVVIGLISIPVITVSINQKDANDRAQVSAERERQREIDQANDKAEAEAERQSQLQAKNTEVENREKRIEEELAASTLSSDWQRYTVNSEPSISFEYPSSWGIPSDNVYTHPDPSLEIDSHRISFSTSATPDIYVWKNNRGGDVTYGSVEGYEVMNIGDTEYKLHIILKEEDFPELCNDQHSDGDHTHCHAGKFAADFNNIVNSTRVE